MKKINQLLFLFFFALLSTFGFSQTGGQYQFMRKNTTSGFTSVNITPVDGSLLGFSGTNPSAGMILIPFGTTGGTIMDGNDSRANNGQTAFGWGNHSSAGYLLTSTATATYQPIGSYYLASNPSGYISSVPAQSFGSLTGKPSTLSGYGITDGYSNTNPNGYISGYTETDPVWSFVSASYRTKSQNDALYYPLSGNPDNFLTAITSGQITTALGFTPLSVTGNGSGLTGITNTQISGLGTAATTSSSAYATSVQGTKADTALQTEADPTVPTYSKTLTGFSVIKSSTDPLYATTAQGVLASSALQPAGNGSSLTGLTKSQVGLSNVDNTSDSTKNSATATFTNKSGNISQWTNDSGYIMASYVPTINSAVTRPVNSTTFTVSTTKQAFVSYNITISCTASIGSASTGSVALQYSTNAGSTWATVGTVSNSNTVSLAIVLNSVQISGVQVSGFVPANSLCRMVSTTAGTTTITFINGQETY